MKHLLVKNAPGLLAAAAGGFISTFLAGLGNFLGAATIALLLGLLLGNTSLRLSKLQAGFSFSEKKLLEAAVVLLAFGMNVQIFAALGSETWLFVGASVFSVIGVALLLGRWFGLSSKMGILMGAGSAICGSAAIGAVSPLLKSREEETGLSIGVINLLSTLGLLLLPLLSELLVLGTDSAGLMIGGVLQSMGHVIGAGFSLSEEVGTIATVVKMGRILFLIPLIMFLFFLHRRQEGDSNHKISFPWFIPFFALAMIVAQLPFFPAPLSLILANSGDFLLLMAMVAIGFKIKIKPLFKMAGPALAAGFLVFAFQILLVLIYLNI